VAASIEGGETYHLSKGDVITIPAKAIAYYGVNIESQ
jgi:quercetin dioxygenase-like cupin family protein